MAKKMTMTKRELITDVALIKNVIDKCNKPIVRMKLLKLYKELNKDGEIITKSMESSDEYKKYVKAKDEIIARYIKKDGTGNPLVYERPNGQGELHPEKGGYYYYGDDDEIAKRDKEVADLDKKNKEVIDSNLTLRKGIDELLDGKVTVSLTEDISAKVTELGNINFQELECLDKYINIVTK